MSIIEIQNVTKKYKEFSAVDNVSLLVEEGECFGLLGPNGAGKTTLIRLITTISPLTAGKIYVSGMEVGKYSREIKRLLGVVPQKDNLDEDLPVLQNLTTFARYFSIPKRESHWRSTDLLKTFKLEDKAKSKIKELSGGMRRRLLIARGMLNEPKILVLDEPTVGLDPPARHAVWQKLVELKTGGITLLLCTQTMEEAALLCDRVAILNHGRIAGMDAPYKLIEKYAGDEVAEVEAGLSVRNEVIRRISIENLAFIDTGDRIRIFHSNGKVPSLLEGLTVKIRSGPATLEDVFFLLTGEELE